MTIFLLLAPFSLLLALTGLAAFFWTVKHNQYEDPRGDAERILQDNDRPL
jgi:cbb3-type cytochrome oxidase maturation protein